MLGEWGEFTVVKDVFNPPVPVLKAGHSVPGTLVSCLYDGWKCLWLKCFMELVLFH